MAKVLILAVLALPVLELAAFVAVAATIGFAWAALLVIAGSTAGVMVLRHAGGNHVSRMRVAMAEGRFSSLNVDGTGGLILLAGILLFIPGFITDVAGLLVLLAAVTRSPTSPAARPDGVVDLEPEQWHRVADPALTDDRQPPRH